MAKPKLKKIKLFNVDLTQAAPDKDALPVNVPFRIAISAKVEDELDPDSMAVLVYVTQKFPKNGPHNVICENVPLCGNRRRGNRFTVVYRPPALGTFVIVAIAWDRSAIPTSGGGGGSASTEQLTVTVV